MHITVMHITLMYVGARHAVPLRIPEHYCRVKPVCPTWDERGAHTGAPLFDGLYDFIYTGHPSHAGNYNVHAGVVLLLGGGSAAVPHHDVVIVLISGVPQRTFYHASSG